MSFIDLVWRSKSAFKAVSNMSLDIGGGALNKVKSCEHNTIVTNWKT